MARADAVIAKGGLHVWGQRGELQALGYVAPRLSDFRGERGEVIACGGAQRVIGLAFVKGMDIIALQVFDDLHLQRFGVGQGTNNCWHRDKASSLGGMIAAGTGDDFQLRSGQRTTEQRHENPLGLNTGGEFCLPCGVELFARVRGREL